MTDVEIELCGEAIRGAGNFTFSRAKDAAGQHYWVKTAAASDNQAYQLLNTEIVRKGANSVASILSPIQLIQDNNRYMSLFAAVENAHPFEPFLANQHLDMTNKLRLSVTLVQLLIEIHQQGLTAGFIDPDTLLIDQASFKVYSLTSWNLHKNPGHDLKQQELLRFGCNLRTASPEVTGRTDWLPQQYSDLYSLGIILYRIFMGRYPFQFDDPLALVHAHIARPVEFDPGQSFTVPEMVLSIINKLLNKTPEMRYPSALSLHWDLQQCLEDYQACGEVHVFPIAKVRQRQSLVFPNYIYGREAELKVLHTWYQQATNSRESSVLIISGEAGVGKSALAEELTTALDRQQILLATISAKQPGHGVKQSAVYGGLKKLIEKLLVIDESSLTQLQTGLLELPDNTLVSLCSLFPELKIILPEAHVQTIDSNTPAEMAITSLLLCLSRLQPDLLLVFDDAQWLDESTIEILACCFKAQDSGYLNVLLLLRDIEADNNSAIRQLLTSHSESGRTLELQPLSVEATHSLVQDTFWETCFSLDELANVVYQKTRGNPFFVRAFLQQLCEQGALFADDESVWNWLPDKIHASHVTDNVATLTLPGLALLPRQQQYCLRLAALMGQRIELDVLRSLCDLTDGQFAELLKCCLEQGMWTEVVDDSGQVAVHFAHNKIQAAARQLDVGGADEALRLKLAEALFSLKSDAWLAKNLLSWLSWVHPLAGQSLQGVSQIQLAGYYLSAAHRAIDELDYKKASAYFSAGVDTTNDEHWQTHYDLCFALYTGWLKIALDSGTEEDLSDHFTVLENKVRSTIEVTELAVWKLKYLCAQQRFDEAYDNGLSVISGLENDGNPLLQQVSSPDESYTWQTDVTLINHLPVCNDVQQIAIQELLYELCRVALRRDMNSLLQVISIGVAVSLKYGNTRFSPLFYAWQGVILAARSGEFIAAQQMLKASLRLAQSKQLDDSVHKEILLLEHIYVSHWLAPVEQSRAALERCSVETPEASSDAANIHHQIAHYQAIYSFFTHQDLTRVSEIFETLVSLSPESDLDSAVSAVAHWRVLVDFLCVGEDKSESKQDILKGTQKNISGRMCLQTDGFSAHFTQMCKAMLRCDVALAMHHQQQAQALLDDIFSVYWLADFHALSGMLLLRQVQNENKKDVLDKVNWHLEKLEFCCRLYADNHEAKRQLLLASIKHHQQQADAWRYYSAAIKKSQEAKQVFWLGLSREAFARYWFSVGDDVSAMAQLQAAIACYQQWQAKYKQQLLIDEFPQLTTSVPEPMTTERDVSSGEKGSNLDLMSVVKASETLSGSIDLNAFLTRMMTIIVENAGAQQGTILFCEADEFEIKGSYPKPLARSQIPDALLTYVQRTKLAYVVDDSASEPLFSAADKAQCMLPRSILMIPMIVSGQFRGVLYLEHSDLKGVFTSDRIDVLQLLANQTAILFDNASLNQQLLSINRELEQKVNERTTELAQAKLKAEEATAAKSNFLANMSHEIRTPMNAVIGLSRIALKKQNNPEHKDYLEKILNSSESLLTLINDILDFSKIEAQKLSLEVIPFSLENSLRRVVNLNSHKIHEKHLEFVLSVDSQIPDRLIGDPLRIEQIIINLVSNAIKFTHEGYIHLNLGLQAALEKQLVIEIRVKDSGIGMSEEQCSRLFQSFSQADDSVTRRYGGTGLGLAICKQLAELMQGDIRVVSKPDQGAEFVVTLKVEKSAETLRQTKSIDVSHVHALVVDDVEIARNVMCDALHALGIKADTVDSGEAALKQVEKAERQQRSYDLVLMDWKMPGMDGITASRRIRESVSGKIPHILMITSYDKEALRATDTKHIVDRFIEKPVSQTELIDAIQLALGSEKDTTLHESDYASPPNLSGRTLLLVEDNELNQLVALEFLQDTGARIEVATDGAQAVNAMESGAFDLVLMDIQMPVMDGMQATQRIRTFDTHTPVIAMTAHAMVGDKERSTQSGMNGHITKPILPEELYAVLESHLEVSAEQPELPSAQPNFTEPGVATESDVIKILRGIPELDVTRALERIQGRTSLFLNLVADFISDHRDLKNELTADIEARDVQAVYRRVHSLKSNTAYIGAFELSKRLGDIELHINTSNLMDKRLLPVVTDVAELITRLETHLTCIGYCANQRSYFDQDNSGLRPVVMLPLLQTSDFSVERHIAQMRESTDDKETLQMLNIIDALVAEMEFEEAAEYLQSWLNEHQAD